MPFFIPESVPRVMLLFQEAVDIYDVTAVTCIANESPAITEFGYRLKKWVR